MSLSDRMREPFVSFDVAFAGTPEERVKAATDAWRRAEERASVAQKTIDAQEARIAGLVALLADAGAALSRITNAAGDLKAAVRPMLDASEFSEHREVRDAFNSIAAVAGRNLQVEQNINSAASLIEGA